MKSLFVSIFVFLAISFSTSAQIIDTLIFKYEPPDTVRYWKFRGDIGVKFQMIGFKDWSKGGTPNLSLASYINLVARYKKDNNIIENKLNAGFGLIREKRENEESEFRKNDDYIILISKYGRNLFNDWYMEGMIDFRTQFAPGYGKKKNENGEYPLVSKFMSPAMLSPSIGIGYNKEKFSFTASPLSGKITMVLNDSLTNIEANGVEPGVNVVSEAGTTITVSHEFSIMENVFTSYNLRFFTGFNDFNFKHTDVNGEFYTRFKINKYISSNISVRFIYDDDYDPNENGKYPFQMNYVLNIGVTYDIWQE